MGKEIDPEEPLQFVFDESGGENKAIFRRVRADINEERAAADTSEAKRERAQREAERREQSLKIFNKKRWSRDEALVWIACPDRHRLARSTVAALFYDRDLPDREPSALLTEAIADKLITEYSDGLRTWYRSEEVKTASPEPGQRRTIEDATFKSRQPRDRAPSKVEAFAAELKAMYPSGRPAKMKVSEIRRALEKREDVGSFGDTTWKKALRLAFKLQE